MGLLADWAAAGVSRNTVPVNRAARVVPSAVLDAFGVSGVGERLPGGEGQSIRYGPLVLKPAVDGAATTWIAELLAGVEEAGFRVARPCRARDGRWVVGGWSASHVVEGEAGPAGRWDDVLTAGRTFHAALRTVPRPSFLADRAHRWALADRVAWGEATFDPLPAVAPLMTGLRALLSPVEARCQVVHGDLSGNVLLAEGQPPAIIDFSPYWRPPAYADAVVAIDGLLWHGAGPELVALAAGGPDFPQMLVRAAIFRLVALNEEMRSGGGGRAEELAPFHAVVAMLTETRS